jgi:hypothetical protein
MAHKPVPRTPARSQARSRRTEPEDNLAAPYTPRTLEHERAAEPALLEEAIEQYETFPALWPVDLRIGDLHLKEEGLGFPVDRELPEIYRERDWHSYVT